MDRRLAFILVVLLALAGGLAHVAARQPQSSGGLPTAFTYQGRLQSGGGPASGSYPMIFRLYSAPGGGTPLASHTATVSVTNGLFTTLLDFGPAAFDGGPRWLELEVAGTTLAPRQALTATPYAIYAGAAPWSGLRDVPADLADGDQVGLTSVQWTDVLSRPAGLDDGDQDTTYTAGAGLALNGSQFAVVSDTIQLRVGEICVPGSSIRAIAADGAVSCEQDSDTTYTAGAGLALDGTELRAQGSAISNTLIVAKNGGDFTSVQAALNSITAASASNPYLIFVGPGVYTEQVTMKPYVTLAGAGPQATVIRWTGGGQVSSGTDGSATVRGASNAALRQLTIESAATSQAYTIGLSSRSTSLRVSDVAVSAAGGSAANYGIYNFNASPTLDRLTVSAAGSNSYAIYNEGASPTINDATVSATNTTGTNTVAIGVYNLQSSAPTLTNVTITAEGNVFGSYGLLYVSVPGGVLKDVSASASGSITNYGILISTASPVLDRVNVSASGGGTNYGILISSGSAAVLTAVSASAAGGSTSNYGLLTTSATTTLSNVRASATGGSDSYGLQLSGAASHNDITATASGATTNNYGVYHTGGGGSATLNGLNASGSGGFNSVGVFVLSAAPTLHNAIISGNGGSNSYGLYSGNAAPVIREAAISGATNSIFRTGSATPKVANSQLIGPVMVGVTCFNNYNENLAPITCP